MSVFFFNFFGIVKIIVQTILTRRNFCISCSYGKVLCPMIPNIKSYFPMEH